MKIILVDQRHGHTRTIILKGWVKGLLSVCLLGAPVALGYFGYELAISNSDSVLHSETALDWDRQLQEQSGQLVDIKQQSEEQLEALTLRLAVMQARLVRLEAVGDRITSISDVDMDEFDFSRPVALGGPDTGSSGGYESAHFFSAIEELEAQLASRQQQLEILEDLLVDRQAQSDVFIAGRPVERGWISSRFGQRTDPFSGQPAYHQGIDFATGQNGVDINTVASGVVTWSGEQAGYGLMVEVNHGNDYTTRYAHAEKLLVSIGDIVKKGQPIALVGSTGRSTGPHVHFEVYKNGRVVDPAAYIHRTVR
ncbi:MAG: M23 family metallopeptidase [Pseudohongiellaceae bacterium]